MPLLRHLVHVKSCKHLSDFRPFSVLGSKLRLQYIHKQNQQCTVSIIVQRPRILVFLALTFVFCSHLLHLCMFYVLM